LVFKIAVAGVAFGKFAEGLNSREGWCFLEVNRSSLLAVEVKIN